MPGEAGQHAMRRLAAFALLCALAASAAAQVELRDARGRTSTWTTPPARIVSMVPSITEGLCALGACAKLVGTDRYSNWPESVKALPKLGGLDDAQVERIVGLKPDVVLAAPSARAVGRLEALGIRVLVLEAKTHADVERSLATLARLVGQPAEGAALWAAIQRDLKAATARVPAALRGQRVYFEIASAPYGAGAASFIGETLAQMGLGNALPPELGPFPKLNPEYVVRVQPDIVMATRRGVEEMPRRPGWDRLRALQMQRSCGFDAERYDMLVRPGPRLGEAAQVLADCLVAIDQRDNGAKAPAR